MSAVTSLAVVLGLLVLWTLFAVLYRCFSETPPGRYHQEISQWKLPPQFDEATRLSRVGISLMMSTQVLFVLWVGVLYYVWVGPEEAPPGIVLVQAGAVVLAAVLFFQELLPRVVAGYRGERIAVASLGFLFRLDALWAPLSRSFLAVRRALVRLLGNGEERTNAEIAEDSIRAAVELGEREGVILEGEKSMIESLLEFHDAEVTEVMTPRTEMVCFEASTPVERVVPEAIACGHSRIPVFRKTIDEIVAVLYVKDLLRFVSDPEKRKLPVEKASRPANFVPENKKLSELLGEFRSQRFHLAIIIDEYGGIAGLVTIEDILEEIVGEIEDEYDPATLKMIRRVDDDTFDLDGRAHVDEVSEALGQPLPENDDYETVAGFLFSSLGRVPKEGDGYEFQNLRFKVTAADERKIKRVRVRLLHPQSQQANGKS